MIISSVYSLKPVYSSGYGWRSRKDQPQKTYVTFLLTSLNRHSKYKIWTRLERTEFLINSFFINITCTKFVYKK